MRRDEIMTPKFFNPSGYKTMLIGKNDGASRMEITPSTRGFDYWCAVGGGYTHKNPRLPSSDNSLKPTKGWTAEILTDIAIQKIKEAGDQPWLMHMCHIIPHLPWHCPDSYAEPYRKKGFTEKFSQLYGSIHQMDDQIGRLLDAIREAGQEDNTIVLFFSDNGPSEGSSSWVNHPETVRKKDSPEWALRNVANLTGHKSEVWENGIRSPLLIRWPGKIKPGIREHVVGVEDVLPTLLDLARIPADKQPQHLPFDGTSFRASLDDPNYTDDREIFRIAIAGPGNPKAFHAPGFFEKDSDVDYSRQHFILRVDNYKFHHLPDGEFRLYDMRADPGETMDVSQEMPEKTSAMATRCRGHWDEIVSRNRTFSSRQMKIDNSDRPDQVSWRLEANRPLRFEGKLRAVFQGGVLGFRNPGARADYRVAVQKSLMVSIVAKGEGLDACAPIHLEVDGQERVAMSRSAKKIVFESALLPAGQVPVSLFVPDSVKSGTGKGKVDVLEFTVMEEK